MEGPTSLSYKGSISDAITEARAQKKLFVVYISGEDDNSNCLEQSTWVDQNVADSVSKYCIFLHLRQGSIEASQFSAIYPQNSIPSITAVGLNGVIIWKHEGYISAENFIENMEKAWAALNLQETAATLLKVALSSRDPEPQSSASRYASLVEQGSSSSLLVPSTSTEESSQDVEANPLTNSKEIADERVHEVKVEEDRDPGGRISSRSDHVSNNISGMEEQSSLTNKMVVDVVHSIKGDRDGDTVCGKEDGSTSLQETNTEVVHSITGNADEYKTFKEEERAAVEESTPGSLEIDYSPPSSQEITQVSTNNMEEGSPTQKIDAFADCSNAIKSNDIYLNIRLPNGSSLQSKFVMTDTLESVKDFVDESGNSGIASYDLAVPYPRRVYSEQDMKRTLCELGFGSRQALIVVPRRQATQPPLGESSGSRLKHVGETDSPDSNGGYFGTVKRILSYMNPFSYFGGNSSSSISQPEPNESLWQYRPNPSLQNYFSGAETSRIHQNPPSDNAVNTRTGTSRPFGSNIHTLKHNDNDDPSADRNTFWNGNSTQYGGDDK